MISSGYVAHIWALRLVRFQEAMVSPNGSMLLYGIYLGLQIVPMSLLLGLSQSPIWVVIKIMVPFWVPQILGAVLYLGPKKGPQF